jgi:hypothetical protein
VRRRREGLSQLALAAALAAFATAAAAGEIRQLESVGAVAIGGKATANEPPHDAAVRAALRDAAQRLALELLSADFDPIGAEPAIAEALGSDPFQYATVYRILEDRGERPALFVEDPEVEHEYVVVVEAHLDVDRIRQRMAENGLLAPTGEARWVQVLVVIEGLESYSAYAALRRALIEEVGARSAVPLEMERGRAVLQVVSDREANALLEALLAAGPQNLRIVPLSEAPGMLRLRVREVALTPATDASAEHPAAGGGAIDTPRRNRY